MSLTAFSDIIKGMKKSRIKWIIMVELIVFYFSLLNVVSHARGPVPYQIDISQPVVQIEDFVPMVEMGVDKTETEVLECVKLFFH